MNENQIIEKAIEILAGRMTKFGVSITSPEDTKNFLTLNLAEDQSEVFGVLFLSNRHQLISFDRMFFGTIDGASVYPREVVKRALAHNASAVIFAHNHPSGIADPSMADRLITDKLKDVLAIMDIRTLDHIIVAGTETYSFSEHGLL